MIESNVKPGAPPMCDVSWNGRVYSNVMMVMVGAKRSDRVGGMSR